ncbi:MAG: 4-hydroxy-2-oxovalerate aldolase [Gemmatimonadaceae bacterium]|nr:4-hydroxy-2-oxovalerate aldolase [Gemmatimonadaceae bacterium]
MRPSKVLRKIRDGQCVRVAALGHYLPFYVRHAAHCAFDAIWLDLEHRAMDPREVQSLLAMCHQHDIDAMVRAPTTERTLLYRYFEDGAAGLLMPLVADAEEARRIARAVKFPPIGNRGLDGAGLDSDFMLAAEGFTDDANRETFVFCQIETPRALDEAEGIAAVEGVDGLFIGPADLGLRLGLQEGGASLEEAIARVAEAAKRHNKAWGIAGGGPEQWQRYRQMGAQMLIGAGDFALTGVLAEARKNFDEVLGE